MKNEANALIAGRNPTPDTSAVCRQCAGAIHRFPDGRRCGRCGLLENGFYKAQTQAFDILGQSLKKPGPKSPMVYGPGAKPKPAATVAEPAATPPPTAAKPAAVAGRSK